MNDRMLMLLEAISSDGSESGPLDLSQRTGLPQATTYRLLSDMQKLGLIEREGSGYRVGNRLSRLAFGSLTEDRLRDALDPELKALADETGETSFAARLTPAGIDLFLRRLPFDGAAGGVLPPTGLRPAICSAAKAILAFLPEVERVNVLARTNLHFPGAASDERSLQTELAMISESSFATCFGEEDPDIGSFATPLTVHGRSGQFSAGIVGPRRRIESVWVDRQRILHSKAAKMADRIANVMSGKE